MPKSTSQSPRKSTRLSKSLTTSVLCGDDCSDPTTATIIAFVNDVRRRHWRGALNAPLPEYTNPIVLDNESLSFVMKKLAGVHQSLTALEPFVRYPRHLPIDEQSNDTPAYSITLFKSQLGPLMRGLICHPNFNGETRSSYITEWYEREPSALAREELRLEEAAPWLALSSNGKTFGGETNGTEGERNEAVAAAPSATARSQPSRAPTTRRRTAAGAQRGPGRPPLASEEIRKEHILASHAKYNSKCVSICSFFKALMRISGTTKVANWPQNCACNGALGSLDSAIC